MPAKIYVKFDRQDVTEQVGQSLLKIKVQEKAMIIKIWNWIVKSSANASNWSLTIKGLITLVPTVVIFLNLVHVPITSDQITNLLQAVVELVTAVGALAGAIAAVYGFVRKIVLTIEGKNDVVNS